MIAVAQAACRSPRSCVGKNAWLTVRDDRSDVDVRELEPAVDGAVRTRCDTPFVSEQVSRVEMDRAHFDVRTERGPVVGIVDDARHDAGAAEPHDRPAGLAVARHVAVASTTSARPPPKRIARALARPGGMLSKVTNPFGVGALDLERAAAPCTQARTISPVNSSITS